MSNPRAKQTTWLAIPRSVQFGSPVAVPAMLRKPSHAVALKRLTITLAVVSIMAQTTRPASSLAQLGAETAVAAWLSNLLHDVPLKTLEVRPPLAARAAQSTR